MAFTPLLDNIEWRSTYCLGWYGFFHYASAEICGVRYESMEFDHDAILAPDVADSLMRALRNRWRAVNLNISKG